MKMVGKKKKSLHEIKSQRKIVVVGTTSKKGEDKNRGIRESKFDCFFFSFFPGENGDSKLSTVKYEIINGNTPSKKKGRESFNKKGTLWVPFILFTGRERSFFFFFFSRKKILFSRKKKKKKRFLGEKKKEKRFENPGKILKKSWKNP